MLIPEFAPQSGVLLTWPHEHSDWQHSLDSIRPVYLEIARAIAAREQLLIICFDATHREQVRSWLVEAGVNTGNIRFACIPTNDTWVRDYGPLACRIEDSLVLQDCRFNAWGDKYTSGLDDRVTGTLYRAGAFGAAEYRRHELVLEGGSIDVDGCATLLTTAQCLLAPTRNPGLGRAGLEHWFSAELGIERVLWLEHGTLAGDDTDAHVDNLARFCDASTIAYTQCPDRGDENHAQLAAMERELQGFCTMTGQPYQLVPLPIPRPVFDRHGTRLPASYANFLVINDAVLVPVYDDDADAAACSALADCFPQREIVAINCLPLIHQYGSLHCATMQLPAGVLSTADI